MIFRPRLAALVLCGEKTVTRRFRSPNPRSPYYEGGCRFRPGETYAVQPGRGKPTLGRIRVVRVDARNVYDGLDEEEARLEGFEDRADFLLTWADMYGSVEPDDEVWRIEFVYVGPEYGKALARPVRALGWELRRVWASGRRVSLRISGDEDRLEGHVSSVSATDAYAIVAGWHVPLDRVLSVHAPSRLGDSTFVDGGGEAWTGYVPRALRQIDGQLGLDDAAPLTGRLSGR